MELILVLSLLIINGCTPLLNADGLMHSIAANNTISTVLSIGDTALKEKIGKSVGGHLLDNFFRNKDIKSNKNNDIKCSFK